MSAPPALACLSADALTAFDLGTVAEHELDQIADHLDGCTSCQRALARLDTSADPLIRGLRRNARPQPVSEPTPVPSIGSAFRATVDFAPAVAGDGATVVRKSDTPRGSATGPNRSALPDGVLAPPEALDEIGRLSTYRVLREIGRGGMGVVFEAEDTQLRRRVALKVMLRGSTDTLHRERFLREARTAAALTHDHIVPVFQVGEDRGHLFIAMPLLKGESLKARLDREPPLALADVLRIGRETATGLAAAHARDLVHRDIKPDNLWLESAENEPTAPPRVKILDFGLARGANDDAAVTGSGGVVGTPAYMAPEQARGDEVDTRADLFSLGVLLYRLVTGRRPFGGRDVPSTLLAVCYDTPRPPVELAPSVPLPLSDLIMRLLDKSPDVRPSARDVVTALAALEDSFRGSPTASFGVALPQVDSGSWVAPKPVRKAPRRRWPVALAMLFALVGISAVVIVEILGKVPKAGLDDRAISAVVIIEIVDKDGNKTRVELPVGSTFKVRPDGTYEIVPPKGQPAPKPAEPPAVPKPAEPPTCGLRRELFVDAELKKPLAGAKSVDAVMQWGWGENRPDARIADGAAFAVRWTGFIKSPKQAEYQFRFVARGGLRVTINGEKVVNDWDAATTDTTKKVALNGRAQEVVIEYRSATGRADFAWLWTDPVWGGERPVPTSIVFPDRESADRPSAPTNQELVQPDEMWRIPPDARVPATAFSANGRFVAFARDTPDRIELFDRLDGKQPERLTVAHRVADIAFSPDNSLLIAGGKDKDGTVQMWDTKTWATVNKLVSGKPVARVTFAPNGKWFAGVGEDGVVTVWNADATEKKVTLATVVTHAIGWADGGNRVLTLGGDGIPREWNPESGKKLADHVRIATADATAATFTADGTRAVVASFQKRTGTGTLELIELATGKPVCSATLAVPAGRVAVWGNGRWVATGVSEDWWNKGAKHTAYDALVLYEPAADKTLREVHRFAGHTKWVDALVFGPDGKTLASGSSDRSWRQWRLPARPAPK